MYFVKTPWLIKKVYLGCIWDIKTQEKNIYLTFDDGPHPEATPFVLDQLKKFNAKATFFCIGKNVNLYPHIFQRIIAEGHSVGNHTHDHLNGWKTKDAAYIENCHMASKVIQSKLFRPPYGKATHSQMKKIRKKAGLNIVMWSVLSGDFDTHKSGRECYKNVISNSQSGSIVVFHDSWKAYERLTYALPLVLEYFAAKGYAFKIVPEEEKASGEKSLETIGPG